MVLTGHEDLRIIRTIRKIKKSFQDMICEMPYNDITVSDLCRRAQINKKTFYQYYNNLNELLTEQQRELSRPFFTLIKDLHLPDDLDKLSLRFFQFAEEQGQAYEEITVLAGWVTSNDVSLQLIGHSLWTDCAPYQKLNADEKEFVINFISLTFISGFKDWIQRGKEIPMEREVKMITDLQTGGIHKFFQNNSK